MPKQLDSIHHQLVQKNMKMKIKFVQDFGFLGITWPGILRELQGWLSWGVFWYRICIYPQLMFQNTPRLKRLVSRPSGSVDLIPTLRSSSKKLVDVLVHDESVIMMMMINTKYCITYFAHFRYALLNLTWKLKYKDPK